MNLLLNTVMKNNDLQFELVTLTNLRFMLLHPLSWFYFGSNNYKQFDILINIVNLFSIKTGYMIFTGVTSGEVLTDTEPIEGSGVASTSAHYDTSLVFNLSIAERC